MFDAMPVMATQVKAGAVTPIAVTGAERSPALPEVPTMIESGVADFEVAGWFGLLAPADTPAPVVKAIRDEVAKIVAMPDIVAQFESQGMRPIANEPGEWRDYINSELDRWSKVIKDAGIKAE
jgi:tripartite-type tricarboxylate transporter receptor subunit TctC